MLQEMRLSAARTPPSKCRPLEARKRMLPSRPEVSQTVRGLEVI